MSCFVQSTDADLGMFSMFGRTGVLIKGPPTRGPANFCNIACNMPEIIEIIIRKRLCVARWRHIYSVKSKKCCQLQVIDTQLCLLTCTTVSPRHCACRLNSVGRYSHIREGPTFFLNRALLRVNPALVVNHSVV